MESPFPEQNHTLHLLEPLDSCQKSLWDRLFARTYAKPFIVDSGLQRRLQFDLYTVQSSMHLEHPDKLSLAYTRKMMAFLLFNRAPARILLLGLGGGSLAKFCYRRLPRAAVTAIEVNPNVIALREAFRIPRDDDRFRVICADGAAYVARLERSKDVILADACDRVGVAPEFDAIAFYRDAHRCLSRAGVFVTNLCGDMDDCAGHLDKIRDVFGDGLMTLQVRPDGNIIVFAFKEPRPEIDWEQMKATAVVLKRRFGLDFPRYLRRIAPDWKLRRWQHVLV
ncbi:MAG: Polyamine aminopropyltransferase [Gammaproteobacteria bacterium]|nr:Polyamine aminopropyltransferase [Gammaproteobacteria bacterium]